ncbi:unnamed protein product [Ceutorhynchus assimilis]|uniref:WASH complex subunit 3 n=1 Tax=Ceutorhynchus assimilis TaxID=467358 RepID=A0A9N9MFN6_9CUCU|nr:unnamed protein product [Ceutorhynchus assimilis]
MGMQAEGLSHVKPDVDYSQIPPIQQKRIIAFVNHFVTNTVSYLNTFSQSCESRFMDFEYKIQKIEASLLILEAQLASIPGFEPVVVVENEPKHESIIEQPMELPEVTETDQLEELNESNTINGIKAIDDPRFATFFRMVRVGVNQEAVKLKMKSEGFDPDVLELFGNKLKSLIAFTSDDFLPTSNSVCMHGIFRYLVFVCLHKY